MKYLIDRLKNDKIKYEKEIEKLKNQLKVNSSYINQKCYGNYDNSDNKKRNYSSNKDYMNSQKERELKSLIDKIEKLKNELDNNRKKYNQKIIELNEKLRQKENENKKLNILNDSKLICNINDGRIKSYSQDKKIIHKDILQIQFIKK